MAPTEYSTGLLDGLSFVADTSRKPQTNRHHKIKCDACGWTARTTTKHIGAAEALNCPVPRCGGGLERTA